jgi:hypothetical protein
MALKVRSLSGNNNILMDGISNLQLIDDVANTRWEIT